MPLTCERCGTFLNDPAAVLYSDAGEPMCFACRERIDAQRSEASHARRLVGAATGALFTAVIGVPISFFFVIGAMIFSVPAMGVAWRMRQQPPTVSTIAALGARWRYVQFATIATLLIGALGVALMLFNLVDLVSDLRGGR